MLIAFFEQTRVSTMVERGNVFLEKFSNKVIIYKFLYISKVVTYLGKEFCHFSKVG